MRSRFTAFALGDTSYLLKTWHPDTRPATIEPAPDTRWYRLDILWAQAGGVLDSEGQVSFRAYYRHPDGPGVLEEVSRFVREKGAWFYAVRL